MVTIDAMAVADPKEPIVPNLGKVSANEVRVLIGLRGFGWDVTCSRLKSKFEDRVMNANIYDISRVELTFSLVRNPFLRRSLLLRLIQIC